MMSLWRSIISNKTFIKQKHLGTKRMSPRPKWPISHLILISSSIPKMKTSATTNWTENKIRYKCNPTTNQHPISKKMSTLSPYTPNQTTTKLILIPSLILTSKSISNPRGMLEEKIPSWAPRLIWAKVLITQEKAWMTIFQLKRIKRSRTTLGRKHFEARERKLSRKRISYKFNRAIIQILRKTQLKETRYLTLRNKS